MLSRKEAPEEPTATLLSHLTQLRRPGSALVQLSSGDDGEYEEPLRKGIEGVSAKNFPPAGAKSSYLTGGGNPACQNATEATPPRLHLWFAGNGLQSLPTLDRLRRRGPRCAREVAPR